MMANYTYPSDARGSILDDDVRSEVGARNLHYTSNPRDSDGGMQHRSTQPRPNAVTFQEDVECVCGARQHVHKMQNEVKRKYKQFDQDHARMRLRWDEIKKKEKKIAETDRNLAIKEEEMKSYNAYLQDKQQSISQLQQQNDATQRALLQRLDECAALEEECRRRLSEYESGLGDIGKREAMLNEASRTLAARKDEIERLEHKLLIETEKLKEVREQVSQEVRQHRRVVEEELDHVEAQKRKVSEMESGFLEEKAAFEDYVRNKRREIEQRLQEVAETNDMNEVIANDLKKREDTLNQELQRLQTESEEVRLAKDRIKAEWEKVDEALEEIRSAKSELKGIKRACTKQKRLFEEEIEQQSRQLNLSRAEALPQYPAPPTPDVNYREIKQAELELQTRAKQVELAAEELRAKHLEIKEYEAQLKQRDVLLKEGELRLEQLQDALETRERELGELQEELMSTHAISQQNEAQMREYREQMALLAIERNSLEGQKAQFEKQTLAKEAELNATQQRMERKEQELDATRQRLERKEQEISAMRQRLERKEQDINAMRQRLERKEQELDAKLDRYRDIKDSQQLESRLDSLRSTKATSANVSNRPFSIPPRPAEKRRGVPLDHITVE